MCERQIIVLFDMFLRLLCGDDVLQPIFAQDQNSHIRRPQCFKKKKIDQESHVNILELDTDTLEHLYYDAGCQNLKVEANVPIVFEYEFYLIIYAGNYIFSLGYIHSFQTCVWKAPTMDHTMVRLTSNSRNMAHIYLKNERTTRTRYKKQSYNSLDL